MFSRQSFFQRFLCAVIVAFMFVALLPVNHSNLVHAAVKPSAAPSSLSLGKSAAVQLNNVELFMQEKGLYLIYSLTYTNNGTGPLTIDDFWAKVKTTMGKSYSIKVADKDKNVRTLAAKSNVTVTYYAPVDEGVTLNKLQINIIKWDFSVANFTRSIGTFSLSKGYDKPTAAFQVNYLVTKETNLKTAIKSVQGADSGEDRQLDISFLYENLNKRNYKATTSLFYIMTSDESLFEATNSGLKDLVVKPKQRTLITLKSTIPASLATKAMKLILGYQSEADGIFIPTASYEVPKSSAGTADTSVNQLSYDGYQVELIGYNRLPAGTQDALTANFKLTNLAASEKKIPSMKSIWTVNGLAQVINTPNVVAIDSRIQLAPGDSTQLMATIMIPYSANLKDVRVTLKETVDAQNQILIGDFKSAKINEFQGVSDKTISFTRIGNKSQVQLLTVQSNDNGKQISINGEVAVTNLESRPSKLQKYGIYLKGKDGQIYPLTVADYEPNMISNGKIIVPFSGKVPLVVKDRNLNLLVTELIPYSLEVGNTQTVATNVIEVATAWPQTELNNKFNNLAVGKYVITFDKVYAYLEMIDFTTVQGLNLEFEYAMTSDPNVDDMAGTYKLRFEIEDQEDAKTTFVKEFILNGKDKTDDFKEGLPSKKTVKFSDSAIMDKIQKFQNYKFSVYYVVNDEKILLAQRINHYFNIEWMNL